MGKKNLLRRIFETEHSIEEKSNLFKKELDKVFSNIFPKVRITNKVKYE